MDESRPVYPLKGSGEYFPRVDDHLVEPEVTRDEIIGGQRVVASPAQRPHARQHTRLDYLIEAHVPSAYEAATDLLTRHDEESDFATDTCVYKEGVDPETGTRYLEEIAFEVVSEQNERYVTEKARRMHRRGVRGRQAACPTGRAVRLGRRVTRLGGRATRLPRRTARPVGQGARPVGQTCGSC